MLRTLSLFSLTPENTGDMACAWGNQYHRFCDTWFGHINDVREDYHTFEQIVIGGGCLINSAHEEGIWRAVEKSKFCRIRAVGVEDWELAKKLRDRLGENFTTRHQVDGFIYEACPSLVDVYRYKLLAGINSNIQKKNEILFACHQNNHEEIKTLQEKNLPYIVNNCPLEEAFEKLSTSHKVVTSSYHFLLWASEFGCEVELFGEMNHKFQNIPVNFKLVDIKKYFQTTGTIV